MRIELNTRQRAARALLVQALNQIEHVLDIDVYGPQVIAVFQGVSPLLWQSIDDAVGNAEQIGLERPWMVRRVRNDPRFGRKLSAALARR